jgi:DNA-binding Lrp family transcriptional regulator
MPMDEIDNKIIRILQKDARTPFKHIAKENGVSRDTINNRFNRMLKNNMLLGTTIILDPKKSGEGTFAFMGVKTKMSNSNIIVEKIKEISGLCAVSIAIGEYDIEGIILGKSMEEMIQAKERIENIPDVIDVAIEVFVDTPLLCLENFEFD